METMAAASETSRRITKFYMNAQLQKWTRFFMDKWAEVNKIFCGHLLETLSNYGDFSIAYRIKNLEKDYA